MTAVFINNMLDEDVDIYIVNQFKNSDLIAKRLKECSAFHDVYYIDAYDIGLEAMPKRGYNTYGYKVKSLLLYLKNMLFINNTVSRFLNMNADYRTVFMSNNAMASRFTCLYLFKEKKSFDIVRFDDGTGSYKADSDIYIPAFYDRVCRRILFGAESVYIPYTKLLYFPDLYRRINNSEEIIEKIVFDFRSSKLQEVFASLYMNNGVDSIDESVLILDTNRSEELNDEGIAVIEELYSICENVFGKDNVIYKKHPRDRVSKAKNVLNDNSIPFELLCLNNNFSDKVLISSQSTALLSPNLFFNQEPYIILLYKLLEPYEKNSSFIEKCVEYLKLCYTKPERIIVPESKEELNKSLAELLCTL